MKKKLLILLIPIFVLLAVQPVLAAGILPACASSGRCTLCDIVQTVVNFGKFLMGFVGALVLLYFFYGGFRMLISAGIPENVKKGKDAMINAVIGLGIVLLAYSIVSIIISILTGGWQWEANLKCAALPGQTNWEAPPPTQGQVQGPGGSSSSDQPFLPPSILECGMRNSGGCTQANPTCSPGCTCDTAKGKCVPKEE